MSEEPVTRFLVFVVVGMVLGYALTKLAELGRRPATVWLSFAIRLLVFVVVVAVLSRSYGTAAGLIALVAAVVTRGLLARRRLVQTK